MKLLIVCALAVAAVSAYPGGHAESYANQKLWSGDHHGGYGGDHGGYIISGYNGGHDDHDDGHHHHAPTPYKFEYGVKDYHTGDNKEAWEHSDGHGNVKGSYSLYEPDGTKRIVEYTADPHAGFNAKVTRVGHAVHPEHHEIHHDHHHY